jgi:hypothetical protein
MESQYTITAKPEVTAKGIAMAVFFWLVYTLLSTGLLSYSENLPFVYAFPGMVVSSSIMAISMIPPWFLVVRELHQKNGWIKAFAHLIAGIIYSFVWYYH